MFTHRWMFAKTFFNHPGQIGSITPSSRFLARLIMKSVPWEQVSSIAELGSGTGALTNSILEHINPDTRMILFEKDSRMQQNLTRTFPGIPAYSDALQLNRNIQQEGISNLDCVISGLPFFNFPETVRTQILDEIVQSLRPGGYFVAFQYSLQMRKELNKRFHIEKIRFTPLNVPPAFVYVCRKEAAL
ncbi:class I SAM-dependent methyltransferase [Paenibacillus lemnae]|uniref:Phospholipid methyltransferase n=1 Tax=Paenibacillus lemnae TaxID=1330551 RepID=A0A848M0Y3_PAELE|nr:phospholipid methyltransferase [Paenibacillus lemnae]NMO94588.1 phospholipid methyltransferase [Paenibacillus lemnae]